MSRWGAGVVDALAELGQPLMVAACGAAIRDRGAQSCESSDKNSITPPPGQRAETWTRTSKRLTPSCLKEI
jgi:hypothetical protein